MRTFLALYPLPRLTVVLAAGQMTYGLEFESRICQSYCSSLHSHDRKPADQRHTPHATLLKAPVRKVQSPAGDSNIPRTSWKRILLHPYADISTGRSLCPRPKHSHQACLMLFARLPAQHVRQFGLQKCLGFRVANLLQHIARADPNGNGLPPSSATRTLSNQAI